MKQAAVIGAGIGGLAAAIRLRRKGYAVTVWETNAQAGGKIGELRWEAYRWDTGPSLFTLPELVNELFALCGKDPRQYFRYERLPLVCRYFYEDGMRINAYSEPESFAREVAAHTADSAESVLIYLDRSRIKYALTEELFLRRSLHRLSTYTNARALKTLLQVRQLETNKSLHQANVLHFKDEKTVQLFDRFATYNGSNPYRAPATLGIIPHLEHNLGAWYPEGGMYRIVEALEKLAEEEGVIFHYNSPVEEIIVENGQAKGITVNGSRMDDDVIISNADVWTTYRQLLPDVQAPERILQRERSSSALIFYWAIGKEFPQLDLHNIFFSGNYLREFHTLFQEKTLYDDPTVYVYISKKMNAGDASAGCENWFVMVNAPADTGQDWPRLIEQAREHIIRKLNRILDTDLRPLIRHEAILDPAGIADKTSSYQGALYGNASNDAFAAFLRHPNFSSRIKRLYFCGGSVHPGGGIPLCLLSAKIATDEVKG